jgi:CRISPR/Cas system CSM-associated protein Csm3 (group 7 of RAMP superfamily)
MPEGKSYWNPYRWVPMENQPPQLTTPRYHHRFDGIRGFAQCTLEALTPLIIAGAMKSGSVSTDLHPLKSKRTGTYVIPGTSLKGMIRSLYELLANAAVPFPPQNVQVDPNHELWKASDPIPERGSSGGSREGSAPRKLDPAARVFGFLHSGMVFRGLVRFSDAHPIGKPKEIGPFKVVVGQPRPQASFYPRQKNFRKFYHHHPWARDRLQQAPPNITQTRTVFPLAAGCQFRFRVDFENLLREELNLLLYCLVLEPEVTVTLSPQALGPNFYNPVTFSGPMCHKLGGCKPQGAGSILIAVEQLSLQFDPTRRYRGGIGAGQSPAITVFKGAELEAFLKECRESALEKMPGDVVRHLRAMMIFSPDDPRKDIRYPSWEEFRIFQGTKLKPTL